MNYINHHFMDEVCRQDPTWVVSCKDRSGQYNCPMAQLFLSNFEISSLEHSEAVVVRGFLDNLEESWVVIPSVNITHKGQDSDIDVILIGASRAVLYLAVIGQKTMTDQLTH